jgi:pyruvate formate lyase activating enzyme
LHDKGKLDIIIKKKGGGSMGVLGRVHSMESFGTLDGPGVRYVLFLQGCALRCLYCHNPDTWQTCGGKAMDSDEIVSDILSYRNFIKTGGVTLSGGEPLLQPDFALDIINKCKAHGIHTAIDTAGSVPLAVSKAVINAVDLVLLDIKCLDNQQCKTLTGQDANQTLDTLYYCESIKKPVWVRHVLLPGYTLEKSKLIQLADYIARFACVETVELLPFHKMGEFKWKELNIPYQLWDVEPPTHDELSMVKEIFESRNLNYLMKV